MRLELQDVAVPPARHRLGLLEGAERFVEAAFEAQAPTERHQPPHDPVRLAGRPGHGDAAAQRPFRLGEAALVERRGAEHAEGLQRAALVPGRLGIGQDLSGARLEGGQIAGQAAGVSQLQGGHAGFLRPVGGGVEVDGRLGGRRRFFQLQRAPRQEARQPALHHRPRQWLGAVVHQGVDLSQGRHRRAGVGVGPVVDDPLGLPQRLRHRQPAAVTGREDLDQRAQDLQRLPVAAALLGLLERLEQDLDRLVVAPVGGAGEVQRRFAEAAGDEQRPSDLAVEEEAGGAAEVVVDRLGDQGVGDLVGDGVAPLILEDQPGAVGEPAQDGDEVVEFPPAETDELPELHPPVGHRQQLQHPLLVGVEETDPGPDPVAEVLGQDPQTRPGDAALVVEGPQEAGGEERVPPGPLDDPVDDVLADAGPEDLLGQLLQRRLGERPQVETAQHPLLVEVEEHPEGQRLVGQLSGPGGGHDGDGDAPEVLGEVVEDVPRRGVGLVDVVEQQHHRPVSGDVGQQRGQALQQPDPGRLPVGDGRADQRHGAQQAGQVVEKTAAELGDVLQRQLAEMLLQRLGPQPERRRGAERAGPADQRGGPVRRAGEHLLGQARLAEAGVARQQDAAELAGRAPLDLRAQRGQVGLPADEFRALGHSTPSGEMIGAGSPAHRCEPESGS